MCKCVSVSMFLALFSLCLIFVFLLICFYFIYIFSLSLSSSLPFFSFLDLCLIVRARKSVDQIGTKRVEGGETITRIYSVKKKLFSIKKKRGCT